MWAHLQDSRINPGRVMIFGAKTGHNSSSSLKTPNKRRNKNPMNRKAQRPPEFPTRIKSPGLTRFDKRWVPLSLRVYPPVRFEVVDTIPVSHYYDVLVELFIFIARHLMIKFMCVNNVRTYVYTQKFKLHSFVFAYLTRLLDKENVRWGRYLRGPSYLRLVFQNIF